MKFLLNKNQLARFILLVVIGISLTTQTYAFSSANKPKTAEQGALASKQEQRPQEIIVLIHGLMRSSLSLSSLKSFLETQGYQVYYYKYPSSKYRIQQHGIHLNHYIETLLVNHSDAKIHFITHSLGGIITREAISRLSPQQLKNIGSLIMLAPPNQGSKLARLSTKILPLLTTSIKPLAELSSDRSAYVHRVPVPKIKIGIIAGRFDAKVPPSAAYLKGQTDLAVVNSSHSFIMNNSNSRKFILNFLKKGTFEQQ